MSYTRTEQARYECLLTPYTDAVELFRKQYRLHRSIPGIQRTITDGELMAACAFRTYKQCVLIYDSRMGNIAGTTAQGEAVEEGPF